MYLIKDVEKIILETCTVFQPTLLKFKAGILKKTFFQHENRDSCQSWNTIWNKQIQRNVISVFL